MNDQSLDISNNTTVGLVQQFLVKDEYPFLKYKTVINLFENFKNQYKHSLKINEINIEINTFRRIFRFLNIEVSEYTNNEFLHFMDRIFHSDLYKKYTINEAAAKIYLTRSKFLKKISSNIDISKRELKKYFKEG
jgi:AraC-like DNA-binding protein